MPVPSAITDLSTSAAGNSPAGSDTVFPNLDDYIRALSAFIAQNYASLATKQASLGYTPVNKAGDTLTGVLAATKGTAALPGIAFSGDTNTGIHSSGADILDLVTAGVAQWRVDSSGRLVCPARKQPCFRGVTSATRTTAGDFVAYSSETDDGTNFDASTGIFTAPIDGWYEFTANFEMNVAASTPYRVTASIRTAASMLSTQRVVLDSDNSVMYPVVATGPVRMSAATTVFCQTALLGGSGTVNSLVCTAFSGRLIG